MMRAYISVYGDFGKKVDKKVRVFPTCPEASEYVSNRFIIKINDVMLVKGSQGVRLEKIVEKLMTNPKEAEDVLVRQSASWKD